MTKELLKNFISNSLSDDELNTLSEAKIKYIKNELENINEENNGLTIIAEGDSWFSYQKSVRSHLVKNETKSIIK